MAEGAISLVLDWAQSIAVLDVYPPAPDVVAPRSEYVVDADVSSQNLASPAVVIAGDHQHRNARIDDISECGQRAKATSWYHRLPFEPKLEEIAVHDQRPS